MESIRDAEAVKVMENTVRDVNIAFVNELAKISDVLKLNVVDIIDGMWTKPFGKGPFYPGIGVGGHCIAVDPEWLKTAAVRAGYIPQIIQLARATNNGMPSYAISVLEKAAERAGLALNKVKVLLLGVSYKPNVADPRESPVYAVRDLLEDKGVSVLTYDNCYEAENTVFDLYSGLEQSDAVILITDHSELVSQLRKTNFKKFELKVFIDGRNCLSADLFKDCEIIYQGIGNANA